VVDSLESLYTFRGYHSSLDPYSLYLENVLEKIMLTITFDYSTDFSKAFDKFRRTLTIIPYACLCVLTYIHLSYMLRCLISSFEF